MLCRSPSLMPELQAATSEEGMLRSCGSVAVPRSGATGRQGPLHTFLHLRHLHIGHCHCRELKEQLLSVVSSGPRPAGASSGEQQPAWKVRGQLLQATRLSPCGVIRKRRTNGAIAEAEG